ncbi:MAG: N-acetylmuramoyl-L-alanine amidase [Pelotomaculum sp.]|nr:N-acetylmuramoyl-L-alanine amidase [Pelotomaculum sp.]
MLSPKRSRITNIWSKVSEEDTGVFSKVVIESTEAFDYRAGREGNNIVLEARGAVANMPEGLIGVNDGLVREISLVQKGPEIALVVICLDHPAGHEIEVTPGIPVRTVITLERSFLAGLFKGKKIAIDPGHGGNDWGGRGPVNLVEKNVVMPVARNLRKLFEQAGAQAVLTRTSDENVTREKRFEIARKWGADLFISIHTHSHRDCRVGGTAVLYSPEGLAAADMIREEVIKKLKLADRGLRESRDYEGLGIPAVEVEVVTITNWVEEGLLRSPTVHKKAAEGIFNGVKNYFARTSTF